MSLPHQIAAYADCFELYDAAKADPKGARTVFPTYGAAFRMRARMNMARYLQRVESSRMYPASDQRHGKSEYDELRVTIKEDTEGEWWVYVDRHGLDLQLIQPLSEVE